MTIYSTKWKMMYYKRKTQASTLMEVWKGKSGNYINKYNEANDGIAFATDGKE